MENVTGIIDEVMLNGVGKGSGIVVRGIKYGSYDPSKNAIDTLAAGVEVTFGYAEKGQYKNLVGRVAPTGNTGTAQPPAAAAAPRTTYSRGAFPIDPLDGQRSIIRQNSLTNSVNFVSQHFTNGGDNGIEIEDRYEMVMDFAKRFESFSSGDTDAQEVAALTAD